MDEGKQDVEAAPSTAVEQEVQEQVVNTEQGATPEPQTQEVVEPSTQEVKPEVKDNRPLENLYWEQKRKVDELHGQLGEIKELLTNQRQTQQQPQYTKAQLMAYAADPNTTTEQRLWAYNEVDKLEKSDREKEYERIVKTTQVRSESENRRNQSATWVAQNFPETVVKDQTGNVLGWNQSSPVLMRANEYMSRSENLRNDPEGFMAAVKMAAFDLGVSMQTNKKLDRTIGQLRKEQKKQLASSGGTRPTNEPDVASKGKLAKLQEEYAKTGDSNVFAEIVKMRKLNPFV